MRARILSSILLVALWLMTCSLLSIVIFDFGPRGAIQPNPRIRIIEGGEEAQWLTAQAVNMDARLPPRDVGGLDIYSGSHGFRYYRTRYGLPGITLSAELLIWNRETDTFYKVDVYPGQTFEVEGHLIRVESIGVKSIRLLFIPPQ